MSRRVIRQKWFRHAIVATAATAPGFAFAQVNGTWTGAAGTLWWNDPLNWTSNPQFPTGGGVATFRDSAFVSLNALPTLGGIVFDGLAGNYVWPSGNAAISWAGPGVVETRAGGATT